MTRARDLGVSIGRGTPGESNAVTDVRGVRVGYTTLISGDSIRTGVTVVAPPLERGGLFAGLHRLNGNGEMTGWQYIREMGLLVSPIAITNTHSVGTVHAAMVAHSVRTGNVSGGFTAWALPVVAETWDGGLNDIDGFHVRPEHLEQALASAGTGPIAEGNVGGGTGMICHGFKGGTGTASRVLSETEGGYTVGVLVQANHGTRRRLQIDGVPVGREIGPEVVPLPSAPEGAGSIIVIVATDAPLLPNQCDRMAQRAALGIGRTGGLGEDSSGDLILAFATGNSVPPPDDGSPPRIVHLTAIQNESMNPLFAAVVEATEEAIVNALIAATTMHGVRGSVAHALPHQSLVEVMERFAARA